MNYVVGKYYRVLSVLVTDWYGFDGWMPILGTLHEDAEIVGFKPIHIHVNWPFAPSRTIPHSHWGPTHQYTRVISSPDNHGKKIVLTKPTLKRMKCKREWPDYPHERAPWMGKLNDAYKGQCMKHMVCPHRGLPLTGAPTKDGIVTCPGHGLRWNIATGELVSP